MERDPIATLLNAVDTLITARSIGQDDSKPMAGLIKARLTVGESVATKQQIIAVLERQIETLPIYNEHRICEMLRCHPSWLFKERRAGRWLNYEVDSRGYRFYTREQILENLRGTYQNAKLKIASML